MKFKSENHSNFGFRVNPNLRRVFGGAVVIAGQKQNSAPSVATIKSTIVSSIVATAAGRVKLRHAAGRVKGFASRGGKHRTSNIQCQTKEGGGGFIFCVSPAPA
ncbi:MAG: hypothetical protein ABSC89_16370 [Verrucomicrobiota bacterium]|jgi:hypothetical protein